MSEVGAVRDKNDLLSLLDVDITYPGWEYQTGERRAFYVRGFTWFRDCVLSARLNVTDCGSYVPQMKELLKERKGWLEHRFAWDEHFSPRQFIDVASPAKRATPKFSKAAEIILLCETIARDIHRKDSARPDPEAVYAHMRIEPALSYIHGFNRSVLEPLPAPEKDLLRRWTGQRSNDVFYGMADGYTVTDQLAHRTRRFLSVRKPDIELGDVDFRLSDRWKKGPSPYEFVDIQPGEYPEESFLE
jgi:hypothetical protein